MGEPRTLYQEVSPERVWGRMCRAVSSVVCGLCGHLHGIRAGRMWIQNGRAWEGPWLLQPSLKSQGRRPCPTYPIVFL